MIRLLGKTLIFTEKQNIEKHGYIYLCPKLDMNPRSVLDWPTTICTRVMTVIHVLKPFWFTRRRISRDLEADSSALSLVFSHGIHFTFSLIFIEILLMRIMTLLIRSCSVIWFAVSDRRSIWKEALITRYDCTFGFAW